MGKIYQRFYCVEQMQMMSQSVSFGQVFDDFFEDCDGFDSALSREAQRTEHSDEVSLVSSLPKEHSSFPSLFEDVAQHLQIGLFACLVLNDFHADHHALPSNVSDERALRLLFHSPELPQEQAPNLLGFFTIFLLFQDVQDLACEAALERPSCVCGEVRVLKRISYLFAGDHCRQGLAIGYCFCHYDYIRLYLLPLEAPTLAANPTEATLDFIRNVEPPVLFHEFIEALDVVRRQRHYSACSHDRLDPKTSNFSITARVKLLLCISEHGLVGGLRTAIQVGPGKSLQLHAAIELTIPSEQVGQRVGMASSPVVAIAKGQDSVAPSVGLGKQDCKIVGLTPA